jgi:hypothetical protein
LPLSYTITAPNELGQLIVIARLEEVYQGVANKVWIVLTTQALKTQRISWLILLIFQQLVTQYLNKYAHQYFYC